MITEIASVATAFGVLGGFGAITVQARTRKFDIARTYVERYWMIDDAIRMSTARNEPDLVVHQQRYLRLSEDEYDLARLGWISDRVWREWHTAIRHQAPGYLPAPPYPDIPDEYARLIACLADLDPDHKAHLCPGVGDRTQVRRVLWWAERTTGG